MSNIVEQWMDAFNHRDLDRLLSLYAENAIHYSPGYRKVHPESCGVLTTHEEMRSWWESSFKTLPGLHYEIHKVVEDGPVMTMFYHRHVEGQPLKYVEESLKIRNGKIVASAVINSRVATNEWNPAP